MDSLSNSSRGTSDDTSLRTPPTSSPSQPVFSPSPEAVSVLQLVKEPIGVVSVCSPALQGKSDILNQSVEETECQRALEERIHTTFTRKEFEDYKREESMKAYIKCSNAIQEMEKELRTACEDPTAKFDDILKVLDQLLSSYELTSYGPEKWQKLASFLRKSLEGPILNFVKNQIDHISTEEADEWKRKYGIAVQDAKNALEMAAAVQDRASKQTQHREDALRAEFAGTIADKEAEIKDKTAKIEQAEQRVTTLSLELKAAESKIKSCDLEISSLKSDIKELVERLETAQSYEEEARILEQFEFDRFEEIQERCKNAEKETKRATELADIARTEAITAQKEKNEIQRVASERLTEISRLERRIESLNIQKHNLTDKNTVFSFEDSELEPEVIYERPSKPHTCDVCGRSFPSGPSLGGHKSKGKCKKQKN